MTGGGSCRLQPSDGPGRVAALLSHDLDRHGLGIDCVRDGLHLTGVVSLPTFNRGMADQQYLFVNKRPVKDRLLVGALRAAYRDLLARDRHPVAALFIQVPGERGRHQRPSGQDRSPLPRSGGGARTDRRRTSRGAGGSRASQLGARAVCGTGGVAGRASWRRIGVGLARAAAIARNVSGIIARPFPTRPPMRRCRRGERSRLHRSLPPTCNIRSAWRAGRWRRPISSPKPRTGW